MRAFIAITLPENINKKLSSVQDRLKKSNADVKWVSAANIHITLRFLGDIDKKTTSLISEVIRETSKHHARFDISISRIGVFPSLLHPQTIWVGIDKGSPACMILQNQIEICAEKFGIKKEARAFLPHLTLGRVRSQKNKHALIKILEKEKDFSITTKIPVNKIVLFSSLITQQGPVYSSLEEFPLSENC
ncbi:RNA 2',3'-cyclic phosphodiesterase [bacterium]|nr:MAG: RNA 2',3'-cyclic phosphodiesterase [bacterium]